MSKPIDPVAFVIGYLAANGGSALAGVPIRGGSLEPTDEPPAVVLMEAGEIHSRTLPWTSVRVQIRAFGPLGPQGPRVASALYRTVSDLLHGKGPITTADGQRIARIFDETGPQPTVEPTTRWPEVFGIVDIEMADRRTT